MQRVRHRGRAVGSERRRRCVGAGGGGGDDTVAARRGEHRALGEAIAAELAKPGALAKLTRELRACSAIKLAQARALHIGLSSCPTECMR